MSDKNVFRKLLPFTSLLVIVAALYAGWTFYSRWRDAREFERRQAEREAENARVVVEKYGGTKLTILNFYAMPAPAPAGSTIQLCYGVSNAKTVKIDPPIADVWPSLNRCIDTTLTKDTKFTLTADDGQGHSETKELTVPVAK